VRARKRKMRRRKREQEEKERRKLVDRAVSGGRLVIVIPPMLTSHSVTVARTTAPFGSKHLESWHLNRAGEKIPCRAQSFRPSN
jgi:hypothetical protein